MNGYTLGYKFKIPHGQELRFAGRWVEVVAFRTGAVELKLSNGKITTMFNSAFERAVRGK